jgi:hypothetical protein
VPPIIFIIRLFRIIIRVEPARAHLRSFKEGSKEELAAMAMRGLTQFIGDVRNCTNKEEEVCGCACRGRMGSAPAPMMDLEGLDRSMIICVRAVCTFIV